MVNFLSSVFTFSLHFIIFLPEWIRICILNTGPGPDPQFCAMPSLFPLASLIEIVYVPDMRSESGLTSPFTPRSGSGTPSLPDEGEYPCPQCDKRFGNRRNLMSHMRRHTGNRIVFWAVAASHMRRHIGNGIVLWAVDASHMRRHTGNGIVLWAVAVILIIYRSQKQYIIAVYIYSVFGVFTM